MPIVHQPPGPHHGVGVDLGQCVEGCGWGGRGQLPVEQDLLEDVPNICDCDHFQKCSVLFCVVLGLFPAY